MRHLWCILQLTNLVSFLASEAIDFVASSDDAFLFPEADYSDLRSGPRAAREPGADSATKSSATGRGNRVQCLEDRVTEVARENRAVRVFVSSTFRDMKAEREELALRVFPELRRLCAGRGVSWTAVDLRWGVTEEQAAEGRVLPICFAEIERCRPFFLGLLGELYGHTTVQCPPELLQQVPWLGERLSDNTSLTELEILFGALNVPYEAVHAYFYFRDPSYVARVPQEYRADFLEENPVARQRLLDLKRRIRSGGLPVLENYHDPRDLGEAVRRDLTRAIEELFPEQEVPDAVTRMRIDHEWMARSKQRVYVSCDSQFEYLDSFAASEVPDLHPLVVLGDSGIGKSALLANWALRYRDRHPGDFVLMHFLGAVPGGNDPIGLLRRIMLELKERFDLSDEVPLRPDKVYYEFHRFLTQVAHRGKIVLVLDALNQVEEYDDAQHLGWLPGVLPRNVRLIVSTLPGPCLDAIRARGWLEQTEPLTVQALSVEYRRELVREFLKEGGRALSPKRLARLVDADQSGSPLFLRAMLEELQVVGEHEHLDRQLNLYLEAPDPKALFVRIIERWQRSYGEGLVSRCLRLLVAARRGLSESELLDLLGADGQPLPRGLWTPFFFACESALVDRAGLLTFAHPYVREAASATLMRNPQARLAAHRELAGYFEQQEEMTSRKAEEWPWHLLQAGCDDALIDLLTDVQTLQSLADFALDDILSYWRILTPSVEITTRYEEAWAAATATTTLGISKTVTESAHTIGRILEDFGQMAAAATFYERHLHRRLLEHDPNGMSVQLARRTYANCLARLGRHSEAESLLRAALSALLQRIGPHHPATLATASDAARVLRRQKDVAGARNLHQWALSASGYGPAFARSMAMHSLAFASFLREQNETEEALAVARRAAGALTFVSGADAEDTLSAQLFVGELECEVGEPRQGLPRLRNAVDSLRSLLGDEHPRFRAASSVLDAMKGRIRTNSNKKDTRGSDGR